jgi:MFS family permease
MAFSTAVILASVLARPVSKRLDRPLLAASGLFIIGLGNVTLVLTHSTWWGIGTGVAVAGLGIGFSSVAGTGIGTDVPETLAGSASGILNTGAQVGTALGTAALILVASFGGFGPLDGPAAGWAIAAAGAAAAGLVIILRRRHEESEEALNPAR